MSVINKNIWKWIGWCHAVFLRKRAGSPADDAAA